MLVSAGAFGCLVYLSLGSLFGVSPALLKRRSGSRSRAAMLQDKAHRAGVFVSPTQLLESSIAIALSCGLAVLLLTGVAPLALLAGGASSALPLATVGRRCKALHKARLGAWPDALRDVVAHLRAGQSIHSSLGQLAESGPEPLRPAFVRYRSLAIAIDHTVALEVVREELADPASDRIIEVLLAAFDQGSSLIVDLLEDLASGTSEDVRLSEDIETAQLETRLEARAAAALPFGVLGLLCATSEDYGRFYSTTLGWIVIAFGLGLATIGLVSIRRLGSFPEEARILSGRST